MKTANYFVTYKYKTTNIKQRGNSEQRTALSANRNGAIVLDIKL